MIEDLLNEEILKPKKEKNKIKASTIILVLIILLVILCILAIVAIFYIKETLLSYSLDGRQAKDLENILIFEENNKIYIPIRRMAQYLNYEAYNGDYITLSEDTTKCYIINNNELVSFTLNSNILTKVIEEQTTQIKIEEAIKEINGELCITAEGAQDAFNFIFYYDINNNEIYIQTLSYLYNGYSAEYQKLGYLPIDSETYVNKLAILDDMLIVKASNNCYGVITIGGDIILETKYDSIQYLKETSDFLVESNNKKGIISREKITKVDTIYDSIKKISNKNNIFYIVEQSGLFGLLDVEGKTIIYPEYNQIGMDVVAYEQNGITNGYILYNKLIPVMRNQKWGLFDIEGNKITDFLYDSFGCSKTQNDLTRTYGVLEVMDYKLIVVSQENKYNLINLEGNLLFNGFVLDSVYITKSEGKDIYYITKGTVTKELIGFLEENGVQKPTTSE